MKITTLIIITILLTNTALALTTTITPQDLYKDYPRFAAYWQYQGKTINEKITEINNYKDIKITKEILNNLENDWYKHYENTNNCNYIDNSCTTTK